MGSIRSRRKKLTTLLTDVNTRLKSVELKSVAALAAEAANLETDENLVTPGSYISGIAPSTWKRVIGGWYYPKQVTGLKNDRVELFLNVDSGLEVDEVLEVSGINSPVNVSKKRKVLGTGQSVGSYRNNKPWYKPIPAGITHTLLYSVGAEPSFKVARALKTRFAISSFSATTTTATIVFGEVHSFNKGDVINISDLGGNMAGIDGLFYVDTVPNTTSITYKFDRPISSPIASTPATANRFVYATVHEFVDLGDSWINTETNPDSLYIWNGIRWIVASDPDAVKKDETDPGPPTNLQVSTVAYPNDGGDTQASATFSWTAPTTNADGSELTDLGGYDVEWSGPGITGADGEKWVRGGGYAFVETSLDIPNLPPASTVRFRVRTIDTGGRKSVYAAINKLMTTRSDVLTSPSSPQITTRLGTVTVRWNALQANGSVPPNYLDYLEVHVGTSASFTPSADTLSGRIDKSGRDFFVITDLPYNQPRYIRLVFVDKDGKKSLPSLPVLVTTKPLVDVDIIGKILSGANIVPGSVTASESIIGETITGGLIQALTIKTGNLEANIITADKINAGAITAVKIRADAIEADKIAANAITADKIRANAITADKIRANSITATNAKIQSLDAGIISAGTLSGRTVRTGGTGKRVVMSSADNNVAFFNANGNFTGELEGDTGRMRLSGDGLGFIGVSGTSINFFNVGQNSTNTSVRLVTTDNQFRLNYSSIVFSTFNGGATNRFLFVSTGGFVNAGVAYPGSLSDSRLKKDIASIPTELGLAFIKKINPVQFKWDVQNEVDSDSYTKKKVLGVVAQEFLEALNSSNVAAADYDIFQEDAEHILDNVDKDDKIFRVDYVQLVPVLIKAVQQLSEEVETLKRKIENG